jgi:hypothetical protein
MYTYVVVVIKIWKIFRTAYSAQRNPHNVIHRVLREIHQVLELEIVGGYVIERLNGRRFKRSGVNVHIMPWNILIGGVF